MRRERTEHGFNLGAAEVTALASDEAKGWAAIGVKTPKVSLQIYVTKTGKVRVSDDRGYWAAPQGKETP